MISDWSRARSHARADRDALPETLSVSADALLEAAFAVAGLTVRPRPRRDPLLFTSHAVLDIEASAVWVRDDASLQERRLILAHELGHLKLHHSPEECRCDEGDLAETPESAGSGYGPRQRRETEANVYAREFLLPAPLARKLFIDDKLDAVEMAEKLGLPLATVIAQLTAPLVLPISEKTPVEKSLVAGLDPSQAAAAKADYGPLLVGAGPGTGKTRTLTARVLFLVREKQVRPENILALTFSRKAAEEMRERIASEDETIAARAAITTFHSYGLDLLRRHWKLAGLPPRPLMLTEAEAFALLERRVASLELGPLRYIHDPAYPLPEALRAISKVKESGITPEELAARAETSGDEIWQDIARLYAAYEGLLKEYGALDFADLVVRPLRLLEAYSDVLAGERAKWRQVLVDEYQDINRSGARLVQLLTGPDGTALWAVGDLRQAIYAFRGASPANVARFAEDFPGGRRMDLAVNYRSRPGLVTLFGQASGEGGEVWEPRREGLASTTLAIAPHDAGQAEGMAMAMRAYVEEGYAWRELAMLCRTRSQARNLKKALVARGVPVGPGPDEGGLLTRPDVRMLLARLEEQIGTNADAYDSLIEMLYGAEGLARTLAEPEAVTSLLMLALTFREREAILRLGETRPIRAFLEHLRRLTRLGTAPSAPANENEDAVRLLTVHGAKGLEFPVVFVPNLAVGRFPPRPMPGLLTPLPAENDDKEDEAKEEPGTVASDEEARLFFVALTRARDHLVLSRAVKHGRMSARPSPLLECLENVNGVETVFWRSSDALEPPPVREQPGTRPEVKAPDAELYLRCPKRYELQVVQEKPTDNPTAYESFKRTVLAALSSAKPTEALPLLWRDHGPAQSDPSYVLYDKLAKEIVAKSAPACPSNQRPLMALPLESGTILVRPDDYTESTQQAERRTLRKPPAPDTTKADPDIRLSLLQETFGPDQVFVRFLQDGRRLPVADRPRIRERHLDDYDRALRGIALKVFPAAPTERDECPSCPYFFSCPRDGGES
ncbi:UvrD-helicase domain-containing protein [Armatimonas sp.]|uniref:UvrD-helicase domain-containing protein n=1 Tax=Armatimonas sp. TaxID=1872638 RepID=UPI00375255AB